MIMLSRKIIKNILGLKNYVLWFLEVRHKDAYGIEPETWKHNQ
jgi:hypothetical protein